MANKGMTQVQALSIAAGMAKDAGMDEVYEVLHNMWEQRSKKSAKSSGPKPEVVEFRARVIEALQGLDNPVTNKELADMLDASSQRTSAALRHLVEVGQVERTEGEKKSDAAVFQIA